MRPSPLRHPVAVLRNIIGLNQKELGELCGCSPRTIQAVELLKLPLSGKLATRISQETGVSVEWLLTGDPAAPPRRSDSPIWDCEEPLGYTEGSFELYRPLLDGDVLPNPRADNELVHQLQSLLTNTLYHKWALVLRWRVKQFLQKQSEHYGAIDTQSPVPETMKRKSNRTKKGRR